MRADAVLFDLWGTLIHDPESHAGPRRAWRTANVRAVLVDHGVQIAGEAIDLGLQETSTALSSLHDIGRDVSARGRVQLFLERLDPAVAASVPPAAHAELEEAICAMKPELGPDLAEGAGELLRALRAAGLRTALISNAGFTTAPNLLRMLQWYGIADQFDALVFSDELQLAKPDGRIFAHALDAIGVASAASVFVGDSPHNDIFGARNAGMFAIQVGHREAPPASGYTENAAARPHATVESLDEVLAVLSRLNRA